MLQHLVCIYIYVLYNLVTSVCPDLGRHVTPEPSWAKVAASYNVNPSASDDAKRSALPHTVSPTSV